MIALIMPVYNTEKYLEEAIESIINQTLSFKENIFLYLMDDASKDGSLAICEKYRDKYPDNIFVTHFETNQGASHARNEALRLCRERDRDMTVGFVDSDDRLECHALEEVAKFFQKYPDVNVAVAKFMYFEAREGDHKLNWRFDEREVVHIRKDYNYPQYYIGGCFFRGKAFENLSFDERMIFWEDAMAVNKMILQEEQYGLVKEAIYEYRKRADESSMVDVSWQGKERYTTTYLDQGYLALMKYCRRTKHRNLLYVQFLVAYHMRLIMMKSRDTKINEMFTEEELAALRKYVGKILRKIRVKVILQIPTSLPIIEAMLSMRAGKPVRTRRIYTGDDCIMVYRGVQLARLSERKVKLFHIVEDPESEFNGMWRGRFCTPAYSMRANDYIFAEHNGQRINAVRHPCGIKVYVLGERIRNYYHAGFAISIPEDWESARFGIHIAEADQDILLNEVVFDEVERVYFES